MKEHVAEIVAAYVGKNQLDPAELPVLIQQVGDAFAGLGAAPSAVSTSLTPAVSIRRSVREDAITCLDCGQKAKLLKRHLTTVHNLTPDEYRTRWNLLPDYPMVAPNYAARRRELAKSIGLGRERGPG